MGEFEEISRKQNKKTKEVENRKVMSDKGTSIKINYKKTSLKPHRKNSQHNRYKRLISRHIIMKFMNTMNKVKIQREETIHTQRVRNQKDTRIYNSNIGS